MPGGMQVAEPYSDEAMLFTKELVLQREVRPPVIYSLFLSLWSSQAVSRLPISIVDLTVPVMFGLAGHFVTTFCPFSSWPVSLLLSSLEVLKHVGIQLAVFVLYSEIMAICFSSFMNNGHRSYISRTTDMMVQTLNEENHLPAHYSYLFLRVLDAVRVLFPLMLCE